MTTSFGGDSQPDPGIEDAGYGLGELPVEPTVVNRLGGTAGVVSTVGVVAADDPASWRSADWPVAAQQLADPAAPTVQPGQLPEPSQPPQLSQPLPIHSQPTQSQQGQTQSGQPQPGQQPAHQSQQLPVLGQPPSPAGQSAYPSRPPLPVQHTGAGFSGRYPPVEFVDSLPYYPSDDFGDEASRVRPYAWTGGRTRSSVELQLETLVSTSELGQDEATLNLVEYRAVGTLCRHPHSVAEVAAKLSVPLGVAKVILSDMAELGLISIHRTFADDDIAAHLVLMERVLSGLRRL